MGKKNKHNGYKKDIARARSFVWAPPKNIGELMYNFGFLSISLGHVRDYFGISHKAWNEETERDPAIMAQYLKGKAEGIMQVTGDLFRNSKEGDTKASIFILDRRGGWDKPVQTDTSPKALAQDKNPFDNVTDPVIAAKVYSEIMTRG